MSRYAVPYRSRASDDRILEWLDLRRQGLNFNQIAKRYGTNRGAVQGAIKRVRDDDERVTGKSLAGWYP